MRKPSETDFFVDVEGVGRFRFGRRTYGDRIAIRREVARLSSGLYDPELELMSVMVGTVNVMMVDGPQDFMDIESLDLIELDAEKFETDLMSVMDKLRATEDSFRKGRNETGEADGQGSSGDAGVLVPEEVQPPTQSSLISGDDA